MAESRRPVSEHLSAGRRLGSDDSTDELWAPILSLSKSSTEVEASRRQRVELAWARMDFPKSTSSAVCPHRGAVVETLHLQGGPTQTDAAPAPDQATQGFSLESSQSSERGNNQEGPEMHLLCFRTHNFNSEELSQSNSGSQHPKHPEFCIAAWGERNHSGDSGKQCHPMNVPHECQAHADGKFRDCRSLLLTSRRLVSSMSETTLDTMQVKNCCQQGCQDQSTSFPCPQLGRTCRDASTMTSRVELRDAAVQTGDAESPLSVFTHGLSPAVGARVRTSGAASLTRDLSWDSSGMVWDTYGTSVDPEELTLAIQKHLGLEVNETTAARDTEPDRKEAPAPMPPRNGSRRKIRCLKTSGCCVRSSTVGD